MSEVKHVVDNKSKWPRGPWHDEPDRVEWRHAGMACLIVRNGYGGNLCGYVAVPPGHPAHGCDDSQVYELADISVHGGLTYSGACAGAICHVPAPGEPDNVWWLGFDCAHSGDVSPIDANDHGRYTEYATYREIWYVERETNRLAEQLAALAGGAA